MPAEYERWFAAQSLSEEASSEIANFKDLIYPLEKTKHKTSLDNMWKCVNLVRNTPFFFLVNAQFEGTLRITKRYPG